MSPEDFTFLARVLRERAGLLLTRDKGYLVQNRLASVMREHRLGDLEELVAKLRGGDAVLAAETVEAMLSRETAFFRDWRPFEHLAKIVLPNLRASRVAKKHLRILSAGCSTGQEPYSIAMQVREEAQSFNGWQIEVVGIDVSATAIASAERGTYNRFDVQRGLPIRRLLHHFTKDGENWRIKDDVRRLVSFRAWNLMDDLYPLGRFDAVFCRNVLIGVDQQTKIDILRKLARLTADDGVLYVGVDEGVTGVSEDFRAVMPNLGIYSAVREGAGMTRSAAVAHAR